jgi:biopolymer transport protein TolR
MAMQLGNGGRGGKGRYRPMAEINVTPMVDVMLVLLVIFMITAPLMTSSVNVDLPKASASALTPEKDPITVSVASDSKVYLANDGMDLGDLVAKLQAASQSDPDRRIYVRGDKTVPYGRMIEVMGTIKQGGFNKVALLVEQTDGAPGSGTPGTAAPTVRPTPPPAVSAPAPVPAPPASPLRRR